MPQKKVRMEENVLLFPAHLQNQLRSAVQTDILSQRKDARVLQAKPVISRDSLALRAKLFWFTIPVSMSGSLISETLQTYSGQCRALNLIDPRCDHPLAWKEPEWSR